MVFNATNGTIRFGSGSVIRFMTKNNIDEVYREEGCGLDSREADVINSVKND